MFDGRANVEIIPYLTPDGGRPPAEAPAFCLVVNGMPIQNYTMAQMVDIVLSDRQVN